MNVLYSNVDLLNRYNRKVPKTWDELIETANIIYEGELKNGMPISRYVSALNGKIINKNLILYFIFILF